MLPQRIVIVGCSGSGKSTLARQTAECLKIPRLELDAVYWQPDWQPLPRTEVRDRVRTFVNEHDDWVIDGNYQSCVQDITWERATDVAWLDLPRYKVMVQMVRRSFWRAWTQQELWNGNRERWSKLLSWDPEKNIIRWSWTRHAAYRLDYATRIGEPRWSHVDFARLRTREAAHKWLYKLGAEKCGSGLD